MEDRPLPKSYGDLAVAVIDDDDLVTRLVGRILERLGVGQVYRITQSPRFLDMVAEGIDGLHLVICDIGMPHADGHAILKAVRDASPDMPFIMLTADQSDETVKRAIAGGVSAYIVKPIDVSTLGAKIKQIVERTYQLRHPG